jgi:hypothetical protein
VIEQGVDCAVRLLRALHTYAGIDTQQGVSQLLGRWEAVEKVGPFAYDHTVKVQLALFLRESVLGSLTRLAVRAARATTGGRGGHN